MEGDTISTTAALDTNHSNLFSSVPQGKVKKHNKKACAPHSLTVRSFKSEDGDAVKKICRTHFRSLGFAAVQYYCVEHFRDLVALLVIGKLFQPWKDLGLAVVLFLVYLFARARIEMELYIFRECPDLDDIINYYMSDPDGRSHFWVAEAKMCSLSTNKTHSIEDRSGTKGKRHSIKSDDSLVDDNKNHYSKVVGCVGCCPTRDDPTVAQLLRLVVAEDVRRMRHGSRLLAQFENFAIAKGYRQVRLYTNNLTSSHMKFIRQHGYVAIQCVPRTLMRGSLIEWKKTFIQIPVPKIGDITIMDSGVRQTNYTKCLSPTPSSVSNNYLNNYNITENKDDTVLNRHNENDSVLLTGTAYPLCHTIKDKQSLIVD